MLRLVEVPHAPFPFGPIEKLPLDLAMLPSPLLHPFEIKRALVELMDDEKRAASVFRLYSGETSGVYDILHYAGTIDLHLWAEIPKARLIILQVPHAEADRAAQLAEGLARYGSAVLVLASEDQELLYSALFRVYAGIVRNRPLTEIAKNLPTDGAIDVVLACSPVSDRALALAPLLDRYEERGRETASRVKIVIDRTAEARLRVARLLHHTQRGAFESQLEEVLPTQADDLVHRVNYMRSKRDWLRDKIGAIPLSDALHEMQNVEHLERSTSTLLDEISERIDEEAARAPRVLNANFAAMGGWMVGELQPLLSNQDYDLLVDVGPVWDKTASVVRGAKEFPSQSLPPSESGGWNVDVVFVSEDFEPHTAAATMFVPDSGRSYPVIDGERAEYPEPLSIRMRAPAATELRTARARLSLHYEGTIIQSAAVAMNVAQTASVAMVNPNRITVDFVLSGSLRDIDQVVGTRDVGLSLLMNDDGSAGHRFILRGTNEKLPAFLPYDPTGAKKQLDESRTALLDLFYEKDGNANATRTPGIRSDKGKDLEQFKSDLFVLARIGNRLRASSLPEARPEDGGASAQWRRSLATALLSKKIIHIARTHSSAYVYPWSLVYQHALEGKSANWKYCGVIGEEWPNGRRVGAPADRCPHNTDPDDHINVLCPYGFWGLKHMIEQPVSVAVTKDGKYDPNKNVTTKIARNGGKLRLAVGVTRDATLDGKLIGTHLTMMRALPTVDFQPPEAETADDMLRLLDAPQIVYFLCHGMYDKNETSVFIGIGPADDQRDHRIYPSMLDDWTTRMKKPNLSGWITIKPLVFINGCETLDVTPDQMLSFVSAFSNVPAGGIVGTEVSVQLPVAAEFARVFFERLLAKPEMTVGEAMRDARWELANKGNLLGLAYTMYCMANLQFV